MGLINEQEQEQTQEQDRRPRDWAYRVVFDRKDLPSLQDMAKHIRDTHDTDMIESFNARCEQKLLGETAVLDNGIELKAVTKSGDLVVNTGLQQCINLILGISSTRWSHFGMSVGSTVPAITDTVLQTETVAYRVALAWAESVGMKLFFGGISSQSDDGTSPNAVDEIGVYNSASAGAVLLNRTAFRSDTLGQQNPSISTIKSAPIFVSSVIELCPIG